MSYKNENTLPADAAKKPVHGKDPYRFSRIMYIIEAALEYFVAIAVGTVYLARVTSYIGISDTVTGILSSFVSLGCGFQIIAVFISNQRPVKNWITTLHIISQAAFALLYLVPLFDLSLTAKTVIFVVLMLGAQIIHNIINAPKINWFMRLVDDDKRGRFTANKEIVSLLGGMAFSYMMGTVMDYYEARGDMKKAFIFCCAAILGLMVLHTATLLLSKEKPAEKTVRVKTSEHLKSLMKDKTLLKIILISVLWNIAHYATISFTGTYQMKELQFSSTFSSVLIMAGSLIRALVSRPMGKYADRHGFASMLTIGFSIAGAAFFINMFTVPSNGHVFFTVYQILSYISMAGINSAVINLVYDYVDEEHRTSALALQNTLAGFSGFFATLILSPLVNFIQARGNRIFSVTVYAQQILSAFSFVITVILLLYIKFVIKKIKKVNERD